MAATDAKPRVRVASNGELRGAVIDGVVVAPGRRQPSSQYMRGNASPFFFNWRPALREQRDDVRAAYIDAGARAIDALHNSGWIAGAVDQAVASTIGTGLRLGARPDKAALGWDDKQANDWKQQVERRWTAWSENPVECDASAKQSIGQMTGNVLRSFFALGEGLALLPHVRRPFSKTATKVQPLPATRLSQDTNAAMRMFQGVAVDGFGMPTAYRILFDQQMFGLGSWPLPYVDVRARDGAGRPQVMHVFDGREGQMRGITPMAPALRVIRQFDQLADATLTAALIQAIFAATVESEAPTEDILRALQSEEEQNTASEPSIDDFFGAKAAWYKNTKIDLGGAGRVAHMFPGEKLTFNKSEHPNSTYEAFAKFLLREIARCLGMTFETLTGDYTGATYSSVRMAGSEIWPIILWRRTHICGRFLQPVYEAWLEEEIENNRIPFPGGFYAFLANRGAAVQATWYGGAKPQADDLKTAKAHEVYKRLGIMSDERICSDLGYDWEDEYEQRAREQAKRKELDLPDGDTLTPDDPVADALLKQPENA